MSQLALSVDSGLCSDCKACEVACRQENSLADGVNWIKVAPISPETPRDNEVARFAPTTCWHCAQPPCLEVCPAGAVKKRQDGIVIINADLCIGCCNCIVECPFGVIQLNPQTNVAEKCHLCWHRIDKGLKPACVNHCETGALFVGESTR